MRKLLEELFAAHYSDVYHYLFSLSRDVSLSEDLAQEVFMDVIKSIAGFRGDASIKTWLFSIARNKWYSHLRKQNRQVDIEGLSGFLETNDPVPEELYQNRELVERIYALLDQEPQRTQKIVMMRLEGFSFYEIATAVGITESSARVIDFRTKTKIRQLLKKEGFTCE